MGVTLAWVGMVAVVLLVGAGLGVVGHRKVDDALKSLSTGLKWD